MSPGKEPQDSLAGELHQVFLKHEQEKEAEKKKSAELFDICKSLQTLLDETRAEQVSEKNAAKQKQEQLEAALETQKAELRTSIDTGVRTVQALESRAKDLENKLQALGGQQAQLERETARLKQEKENELLTHSAEQENSRIAAKQKQEELEAALQTQKNRLLESEKQNSQKQAELLGRQAKDLEQKQNDFDKQISRLKAEAAEKIAVLEEIKKQNEFLLKEKSVELEKERVRAEIRWEELRERKEQEAKTAEQKLWELTAQKTQLEQETARLKEEKEKQFQDLNQLNDKSSELDEAVKRLTLEMSDKESVHKARTVEQESNLLAARQKQVELQNGLDAAVREGQAREDQIRELALETAGLKEEQESERRVHLLEQANSHLATKQKQEELEAALQIQKNLFLEHEKENNQKQSDLQIRIDNGARAIQALEAQAKELETKHFQAQRGWEETREKNEQEAKAAEQKQQELIGQRAKIEQEAAHLKEEKEKQAQELSQLIDKNNELVEKAEKLELEMAAREKEMRAYSAEQTDKLTVARQQQEELESALQAQRNLLLEREKENSRRQIEMQESIDAHARTVQAGEKQINDFEQKLEALKGQRTELELEATQLKEEKEKQARELNQLNGENSKLDEAIKRRDLEIAAKESELKAYSTEQESIIAAAKQKQEELEVALQTQRNLLIEGEKENRQKQADLLDQQVKDLEQKQNDFDKHIAHIQGEAVEKIAALEEAKKQNEILLNKKIVELERAHVQAQQTWKEESEKKLKEAEAAAQKIQALMDQRAKLEAQSVRLKEDREKRSQELNQLSGRNSELDETVRKQELTITELKTTGAEQESCFLEALKKQEALETALKREQEKNIELQNELFGTKEKIKETESMFELAVEEAGIQKKEFEQKNNDFEDDISRIQAEAKAEIKALDDISRQRELLLKEKSAELEASRILLSRTETELQDSRAAAEQAQTELSAQLQSAKNHLIKSENENRQRQSEMQVSIDAHTRTVQDGEKQIKELEQKLQALIGQRTELELEAARLKEEKEKQAQELSQLIGKNNELVEKAEKLELKISEKESAHKAHSAEQEINLLASWQKQEQYEKERIQAEGRWEKLKIKNEQEAKASEQKQQELSNQHAQLEQETARLKEEKEKQAHLLSQLNSKNSELDETVKRLELEISARERELIVYSAEQTDKLTAARQQQEALEATLQTQKNLLIELENENRQRQSEMQASIDAHARTVQAGENQIKGLELKLQEIGGQRTELELEAARLKEEKEKQFQELNQLNDKNRKLDEIVKRLEVAISEKENEHKIYIAEQQEVLAVVKQNQEELENTLRAERKDLAELKTELSQTKAVVNETGSLLARMTEEAGIHKEEFEQKNSDFENKISRIQAEAKAEIEALDEVKRQSELLLKEKSAELEAGRRLLSRTEIELQDSRAAAEQAQAELSAQLQAAKNQIIELHKRNDAAKTGFDELKTAQMNESLAFENKRQEFQLGQTQLREENQRLSAEIARQLQKLQEQIEKNSELAREGEKREALRGKIETELKQKAEASRVEGEALLESKSKELEAIRLAAEQKQKELGEAIAAEKNRITILEGKLAKTEAATKQWEELQSQEAEKTKSLQRELEQKEKEFEDEKQRLNAEAEQKNVKIRQSANENTVLTAQLESLEKARQQSEKELVARAEGFEARSKELQDYLYDQMGQKKKEIEMLLQENLALKDQGENLTEKYAKQKQFFEKQEQKNKIEREELGYQKTELMLKISDYQAQINKHEDQKKKQQEKYDALEAVKNTIFMALKKEKECLSEAGISSEMLQRKLAEAYEEIKENLQTIEKLKRRLNEIAKDNENKIKDIISENEPWKTKSAELLSESEKLTRAFQEEVKRTLHLEAELRKVQASLPAAKAKELAPVQQETKPVENKKSLSPEEKLSGLELILALEDQNTQAKKKT